jgi:hypothetical protein
MESKITASLPLLNFSSMKITLIVVHYAHRLLPDTLALCNVIVNGSCFSPGHSEAQAEKNHPGGRWLTEEKHLWAMVPRAAGRKCSLMLAR